MIGDQSPRPAQSPRANPAPINRGQPTRPNRCKPRQSPPANGPTPANPRAGGKPKQPKQPTTRANQPGPNPRPNNRPIAGGQSTRKRANQPTRANPQQNPNNPANGANYEVSAHLLSKAKKTPVLPGVVLVLRQFPIII
jgi:hypothetical protein